MKIAYQSALFERTECCGTGLPSMTRNGSIGLGFKLEAGLANSMSARDIDRIQALSFSRRYHTPGVFGGAAAAAVYSHSGDPWSRVVGGE
jgi:hypothetical protein